MYLSFFPFSRRPFSSAPRTDDYFPATDIDSVLASVTACIERHAGPTVVVGATGQGKTLLCQMIHRRCGDAARTLVVNGSRCRDNRSLFQNLLYSMGLPYGEMDEGQLRLTLVDCLTSQAKAGSGTLLVIDEADLLGTPQLEELQGLASLTGSDGWCVDLVLIGDSRLEELLHVTSLQSLNQRIAFRGYLSPWTYDDTLGYIRSALDRVLTEDATVASVFEESAMDKVHRLTDGVPRLVNQLCDYALVMAAAAEAQPITARAIEEAWGDLQQLPARSTYESKTTTLETDFVRENHDDEIEFGQLDDEPATDSPQLESDSLLRGGLDAGWDAVKGGVDELEQSTIDAEQLPITDFDGGNLGQDEAFAVTPKPTVLDDIPPRAVTPEKMMPIATPPNATPSDPGNVHRNTNPFLEEFDDEEIVFSKHSLIAESPARMRNHVSTSEGVALSDAMRAMDDSDTRIEDECRGGESNSPITEFATQPSFDETDANAIFVESTCHDWMPSESSSQSVTDWMAPIGAATISAGTGDAAYQAWPESPAVIDRKHSPPAATGTDRHWSEPAGGEAETAGPSDTPPSATSSEMNDELDFEPELEPELDDAAHAPLRGELATASVPRSMTTAPRHREAAALPQQRSVETHPRDRDDFGKHRESDKKRAQRRFGRLFSRLNQPKQ